MTKKEQVAFPGRPFDLVGDIHFPDNFDSSKKYAAIVVSHPGSSNLDQTSGLYSEKLAEKGFIAFTFDAGYQGGSGGEPRFLEAPYARTEDISYAIDYLVTLDYVDENRIGAAGVCAGGGYTLNAAKTEHRIKAVAGIAAANIGSTYREAQGTEDDVIATLEQVANQRTAKARGAEEMIVPWIPSCREDAEAAGITEIDYYRTDRGYSSHSDNNLLFTSLQLVLGFDANALIEKLLTQPLQLIVGDIPGAFSSYRNGFEVYNRAASKEKD